MLSLDKATAEERVTHSKRFVPILCLRQQCLSYHTLLSTLRLPFSTQGRKFRATAIHWVLAGLSAGFAAVAAVGGALAIDCSGCKRAVSWMDLCRACQQTQLCRHSPAGMSILALCQQQPQPFAFPMVVVKCAQSETASASRSVQGKAQ